jgi:hypothetical protein
MAGDFRERVRMADMRVAYRCVRKEDPGGG